MRIELLRTPRSFRSIDAIRTLRDLGGISLKEAKAAIESAMRHQSVVLEVASSDVVSSLRALGVECRALPQE